MAIATYASSTAPAVVSAPLCRPRLSLDTHCRQEPSPPPVPGRQDRATRAPRNALICNAIAESLRIAASLELFAGSWFAAGRRVVTSLPFGGFATRDAKMRSAVGKGACRSLSASLFQIAGCGVSPCRTLPDFLGFCNTQHPNMLCRCKMLCLTPSLELVARSWFTAWRRVVSRITPEQRCCTSTP